MDAGRSSTGIAGLDEILGGGLPERRSYLLVGSAGSGKTILSLQFLVDASGNHVGEKLRHLRGVLSGAPSIQVQRE
jgi:circadian clock protein KaiC